VVVDAKEMQEKYAGIFAVRTRLVAAVAMSGYELVHAVWNSLLQDRL
jgi:hypothetical protein